MTGHTLATGRAATLIKLAFAAGAKVAAALAAVLMTIMVTRYSSAEEAGIFLFGFSIISVLSVVLRIGLDPVVLREVAGVGLVKQNIELVNKSLIWIVLLSVLVIFVGFITTKQLNNIPSLVYYSDIWLPVLCTSPLLALVFTFSSVYQGQQKVIKSTFLQNLGPTLIFLCIVSIFLFKSKGMFDSEFFFSVYFLSVFFLLFIIASIWFVQKKNRLLPTIVDPSLFAASKRLWGAAMLGLVVQWSGVLYVGANYESEQVAFFSAAQRVATALTFLLMVNNTVMAPRFARLYRMGEIKALSRLVKITTRMLMFFVLIPLCLFILFSTDVMSFFGKEYEPYSNYLIVLVIGQGVNVSTGSVAFLLNMTGHDREFRRAAFASALLVLILLYPMSQIYGVLGVAISVSLGLIFQNFVAIFYCKERLGFMPI